MRGRSEDSPRFAVSAEWSVDDAAKSRGVGQRANSLFNFRRVHIDTFALDWLLKSSSAPGRYIVLGLYADEEGARRTCREHPAVQAYAAEHPAAAYAARNVSGLRVFQVTRLDTTPGNA